MKSSVDWQGLKKFFGQAIKALGEIEKEAHTLDYMQAGAARFINTLAKKIAKDHNKEELLSRLASGLSLLGPESQQSVEDTSTTEHESK